MYGIMLDGVEASMLEKVMGVIPSLIELGTTCFSALIDNPITLVYVGAGFVGVGFGLWRKMSKTARRG